MCVCVCYCKLKSKLFSYETGRFLSCESTVESISLLPPDSNTEITGDFVRRGRGRFTLSKVLEYNLVKFLSGISMRSSKPFFDP